VSQHATDLQNLLNLIREEPGHSANYYAVKLNLSHAYTRRLLVQLEQLGELDSKRVRVYRVAVRP
jgi:DNA-binding IclR family transcriptional regulator